MHSLDAHIAFAPTGSAGWLDCAVSRMMPAAGGLVLSAGGGANALHTVARESMSPTRTLTSLVVVGLGMAGCRSERPELVAELRGVAYVDPRGEWVFDARQAPVIAIEREGTADAHVSFGSAQLSGKATRRGPLHIIEVEAPSPDGAAELCAQVEEARRCWSVRFEGHPLHSPRMSNLQAADDDAFARQLAELDGLDRVWGQQIRARRLARNGRTADALAAWQRAADLARDAGRRREAARSLRAASFMAIDAARYTEAESLLDEALSVLGDAATEDDRLLDQYYRAFGDYALSHYREATQRLHNVAERAWASGRDALFGFTLDLLAVVLVDQGRIAEAERTIEDKRLSALAEP